MIGRRLATVDEDFLLITPITLCVSAQSSQRRLSTYLEAGGSRLHQHGPIAPPCRLPPSIAPQAALRARLLRPSRLTGLSPPTLVLLCTTPITVCVPWANPKLGQPAARWPDRQNGRLPPAGVSKYCHPRPVCDSLSSSKQDLLILVVAVERAILEDLLYFFVLFTILISLQRIVSGTLLI